VSINTTREKTIRKQIRQYFQQVVYSVNQPAAARGMQSAFWNVAYFDKLFFEGMFGDFYFPDGEKPDWESLEWVQREFMQWFNEERTRCILTFPVESFALVYKEGKFQDESSADFVADELSRGHSFFIYISDTVDSLSSCCRLKNKLQTKIQMIKSIYHKMTKKKRKKKKKKKRKKKKRKKKKKPRKKKKKKQKSQKKKKKKMLKTKKKQKKKIKIKNLKKKKRKKIRQMMKMPVNKRKNLSYLNF
jgi:hypothetical protein